MCGCGNGSRCVVVRVYWVGVFGSGSVWGWECVVVIVLDEGVGVVGVSEQIGIDLWWE